MAPTQMPENMVRPRRLSENVIKKASGIRSDSLEKTNTNISVNS